MIQNGLVSAMLKWPLGRADFHVRHGPGVRQFIEVAQKFAGEVSTKLSTNCSDSAVTVYWQITLQSGTCRIVCRGKAVHRTHHGDGGMEAASLLRVRRGLTSWASALVQRSTGSMAENHTSTVSKNVSKGARTVLVRVGAVWACGVTGNEQNCPGFEA